MGADTGAGTGSHMAADADKHTSMKTPAEKTGAAKTGAAKTAVGEGAAPRLLRPVVLVGMMGAGKTAVGTQLAKLLQVPFLDSDEELVRAAQRSVAEIFARDGEAFFRARESEVLARLMAGPVAVISTGGGAFVSQANRDMIARSAVSVWLKADLDLLWQRVRHNSARPLLQTADPRATLAAFLEARGPLYAQAQVIVEAQAGLGVEAMAQRVIEALQAEDGVIAPRK